MALISFEASNQVGDLFLDLLSRHKIDPPVGSGLESELLSLTELIEVAKTPALITDPIRRILLLRTSVGLLDLAAKVLSVEHLPEFPAFLPHLRLIAKKKFRPASLGQNTASGPYDDTSRKIAELYVGCLAAYAGTNIRIDDPERAVGDNPDVLVDVEETEPVPRKRCWGLAIKAISSRSGQTIFERIQEGAEQIDRESCKADVGIVIINAKSVIDHESIWNPPAAFANLNDAVESLGCQLKALIEATEKDRKPEEWNRVFGKKAVRPVLFMGQSMAKLPTPVSSETAAAVKIFMPFDAAGIADPVAHSFAGLLNDYMQKIRVGRPGSHGHEPE
jgi:hypothetical protein